MKQSDIRTTLDLANGASGAQLCDILASAFVSIKILNLFKHYQYLISVINAYQQPPNDFLLICAVFEDGV